MTDPYPIRTIHPDELTAWLRMVADTWGQDYSDQDVEDLRALIGPDLDRMLGAFDGDQPVGATGYHRRLLTLPGGRPTPIAAVNWVGVSPTHRRRGLLTALTRRQLTELHESGAEPIAVLTASEAAIYGRFGYGIAGTRLRLTVDSRNAAFTPAAGGAPAGGALGAVRRVPVADARPLITPVYEAVRTTTVGWLDRPDRFWHTRFDDPEHQRDGATALRVVVHGAPDGYAIYRLGHQKVHLVELAATTPASHAALWRYLLDLDLHPAVECDAAPDEPLLHLLLDHGAAAATVHDQLHVRLVDLGRALRARAYSAPVDVVLEVTDRFCPWNSGRHHLAADPGGVSCEPTGAPADLRLSAAELGAVYLGGTSLAALAAAGRVEELRPGAVARAAAAFRGEREPFYPGGEVFPVY
ncbi:GNAT family N-acetyltransferase [Cryptosporangium aurantiacum]|uniref:GNAT family N-acetyltransferase n=1 Tax=Cryptosporangium aurantiacum TaxID=134849 RepID=UPI000934A1B1|nr:GNAT family N-acetyltransferase [Cryptosporangium aurantiacum]